MYELSRSLLLLVADSLNLLHIGRLFVACDYQVDERQESPDDKSNMEDVMLVECRIKTKILDLKAEYHVDFGVICVRGE
jgi:hypothetical protein